MSINETDACTNEVLTIDPIFDPECKVETIEVETILTLLFLSLKATLIEH